MDFEEFGDIGEIDTNTDFVKDKKCYLRYHNV